MNYEKRDYCVCCGRPATNAILDWKGHTKLLYCRPCIHQIKFSPRTPLDMRDTDRLDWTEWKSDCEKDPHYYSPKTKLFAFHEEFADEESAGVQWGRELIGDANV